MDRPRQATLLIALVAVSAVLVSCGSSGAAADDIEAPDLLKLMVDRATKQGFDYWIEGPLGTVHGELMTYGEALEFAGRPLKEGTSQYERRDVPTFIYVFDGKVNGQRRGGSTFEDTKSILITVDVETSNTLYKRTLLSDDTDVDLSLLRVIEIPDDIDSYAPRQTKSAPVVTAADAATAITD